MKKGLRAFLLWFSLVIVLFTLTGCNHTIDENSPQNDSSNVLTLKATIKDDNPVLLNSDSRTILPASVSAGSYKYYLVAKNMYTLQYILPKTYLTLSETGTDIFGTIECDDFEPDYYEFTLYALKNELSNITLSNIKLNASLCGTCSADTRTATSINFTLSSANLTGRGKVYLKLCTTSDWTFDTETFTATAALYNKSKQLCGTDAPVNIYTLPSGTPPSDFQYYTTIPNGLEAGSYVFKILFALKKDPSIAFEYSAGLIILPNMDTVQMVIIPNLIEYVPQRPTNLKASYLPAETDDSEYYNVNFTWNDNSNDEKYFQLELIEPGYLASWDSLRGTTTPWSDSYVTSLYADGTQTIYDNSVRSSGVYVDGSLSHKGSTTGSLTIKMEFGKRYLARICAVNDTGKSDYTYLDLSAGGTGKSGYFDFETDAKSINRFRITYELSGQSIVWDDNSIKIEPVYCYYSQTEAGIPVYQPSSKSENTTWTGWFKNSSFGTAFTDIIYTGADNLTIFANLPN